MKYNLNEKSKTKGRKLCIALLVILVIYSVIAILPRPNNYKFDNPLLKDGKLPDLIAHRGGAEEFPGNTLEAFYHAYTIDKNVIFETDVSITKDGVVILCHDARLDGTTNVSGEIKDWLYTDLVSNPADGGKPVNFGYDNPTDDEVLSGERKIYTDYKGDKVKPNDLQDVDNKLDGRDSQIYLVTTLEDLLKTFPHNRVSVEIKQKGDWGEKALNECVKIINKYDAWDRVNLASFYPEIFTKIQKLAKSNDVPDSYMYSPAITGVIAFYSLSLLQIDNLYFDKITVLQIPMSQYGFNLATKNLINKAHAHNIAVQYWTVDDVDDMRKLVELNADGIMTDRPTLLKQVLDEYR
jgi:glycerophosphoryl diester phosphodiesterase